MGDVADLELRPIGAEDEPAFLVMAGDYMRELDPSFAPRDVWRRRFLGAVLEDPERSAHWFEIDGAIAGFVVTRLREHHYDPARRLGAISEFYVAPDYRHRGVGGVACAASCELLASSGAGEIEVEVVVGNRVAEQFWAAQGFGAATTRMRKTTGS